MIFLLYLKLLSIFKKSKSDCLNDLPSGFKALFQQSFDTYFSFLGLFVDEILAVLLVYPLRLPVIFLLYLKFFYIFEQQESQLVYILVTWL